jgi:hypothetical protein
MVCGALQLSQNNEPDVEGWAGCPRVYTDYQTNHINLLSTPQKGFSFGRLIILNIRN